MKERVQILQLRNGEGKRKSGQNKRDKTLKQLGCCNNENSKEQKDMIMKRGEKNE